ncbi:MFS transporter [Luteolibacter algae]|uniref:MFS transporter n=1 Tax=Luteolibacter algae TaxID=454151 RepID=A0ABW5DAB1_9BACT
MEDREKDGIGGNPRKYVWFTTLYNARAYYPILAVLFLDLGLTLDQFVMLNLVWAATIFIFEVPSGALADTLGRKTLLVAASVLMVVEMSCLLFAPKDGGWLLFSLCVANRLLSGLSEAAASGADEALAYDSMPEENREEAWDELLATAMRFRSVGFVIAMVIGGLLYDPAIINKTLPDNLEISAELAHRLPVALVLMQAIACVSITLGMIEPVRKIGGNAWEASQHAMRLTLKTARWVFTTPRTLAIVVIGLSIDSIVRNFATINSSYYRMIELPAWSFGFIGAAIGLGGYIVPGIAARLNKRFSTWTNFAIIAGLALTGLIGVMPGNSYWCLLPAALLMMTMGFLAYTISRSLNKAADSSKRATVLSVKGLAFNLGYGLFSLAFSRSLASTEGLGADNALRQVLLWQIPYFVIVVGLLLWWGHSRLTSGTATS